MNSNRPTPRASKDARDVMRNSPSEDAPVGIDARPIVDLLNRSKSSVRGLQPRLVQERRLTEQSEDDDDEDDMEGPSFVDKEEDDSCWCCPKHEPCIRNCWMVDVTDDNFSMLVGIAIIFNAIIIGLETDLQEDHFQFFEHFFVIFFLIEFFLTIYQRGGKVYFTEGSTLFDFFLVVFGVGDLYIMPLLMTAGSGPNLTTLRLFRMARMARILRLFKIFKDLMVIMNAFVNAFSSVLWVGVLTLIIDYMFAVALTKLVGHNYKEWGAHQEKIEQWFGNIPNSIQTLFIVMTLAEWDEIAMTVQSVYPGWVVFGVAVTYVMICAFTMVSLIIGIISEAIVEAQNQEAQATEEEEEREKEAKMKEMEQKIRQLGGDDNGPVKATTLDDFFAKRGDYLIELQQTCDIKLTQDEMKRIINKLAAKSARTDVEIVDLVEALKQQTGTAKALKIWELKHDVMELQNKQDKLHKQCEEIKKKIKEVNVKLEKRGLYKL